MQIYKKIKFVDIAKKAGVSNAAVSRYVNGSGYVSEEKKKMIQKAMDELEYTISEKKEMKQNKIFAKSIDIYGLQLYDCKQSTKNS